MAMRLSVSLIELLSQCAATVSITHTEHGSVEAEITFPPCEQGHSEGPFWLDLYFPSSAGATIQTNPSWPSQAVLSVDHRLPERNQGLLTRLHYHSVGYSIV
jgi:hypothetical protein